MTSNIMLFNFENIETRFITDDDGTTWVVAKDVAKGLGYSENTINNAMTTLFQSVPEIWRGKKRIFTPSGEQDMLCLTEQGLYFFLGRSDKQKALPYQMWLAGTVVPSIRKNGLYATPDTAEKILNNPDLFIEIIQGYKEEKAKRLALQTKIEADKPKVIFADSVASSKSSILIRELAKLLRQNGVNVGQNRLFKELRNRGFLIKFGSDYNMPTQRSMELGIMEIVERSINRGDGEILVTRTPKITGKGQIYFCNLFSREHI